MSEARLVHVRSGTDGLLGGCPPIGIAPSLLRNRYFATVRIGTAESHPFLSIFVSADDAELLEGLDGRFASLPPAVELLLHGGELRRDSESAHCSALSAHQLALGAVVDDDLLEQDGHALTKLGGSVFCDRPRRYERELQAIATSGYEHILQVAFAFGPHPDDDEPNLRGSWPFLDRTVSFFRRGRSDDWMIFMRK